MQSNNYLLKIFGISLVPKVVTVILTLLSLPLMLNSLGSYNYGIYLFILSITNILEAFVDFGISAAAGKEIAISREISFDNTKDIFLKWSFFQLIFTIFSFPLFYFCTIGFIYIYEKKYLFYDIILLLVLSCTITIFLNFLRFSLRSLLRFKEVSFLDTTESILRSLGFLLVAFFFKKVTSLVLFTLITELITLIIGIYFIQKIFKFNINFKIYNRITNIKRFDKYMFYESLKFLWQRLATRIFQSLPMLFIGKYLSLNLVGEIGAFSKIGEIINLPFTIIGNALAVKAPAIVNKNMNSKKSLWNVCFRFLFIAFITSLSIILIRNLVSKYLLPNSLEFNFHLIILSFLILSNAISSITVPMSDYLGGISRRNIIVSVFTIFIIPCLYIGYFFLSNLGVLTAYVFINLVMSITYASNAYSLFFKMNNFKVNIKNILFNFSILLIFIILFQFSNQIISLLLFWLSIIVIISLNPQKRHLLNINTLFHFE